MKRERERKEVRKINDHTTTVWTGMMEKRMRQKKMRQKKMREKRMRMERKLKELQKKRNILQIGFFMNSREK